MSYKVSESHVHGCIEYARFDTLAEAIECADKLQTASNSIPDDGWGSRWIVTRSGWYPTEQIKRLYETTPNKVCWGRFQQAATSSLKTLKVGAV